MIRDDCVPLRCDRYKEPRAEVLDIAECALQVLDRGDPMDGVTDLQIIADVHSEALATLLKPPTDKARQVLLSDLRLALARLCCLTDE